MKKRHYRCENCGAELIIDVKAESGKCDYCGAVYYIDKQKPAEVHHYFGNIRITPLRIVLAAFVVAVLAAAIVVLSLYFAGVFTDKKNPVNEEFKHESAYLYAGTYLVGEDLDAGEYAAFKDPAKNRGAIYVLTDPNASVNTSAKIDEYVFANNAYFTVENGVYLKVVDCNVFKVGDKTVSPMKDGSFEGRIMLRGGTDIPVGNYIVHNDDAKSGQHTDIICVIGGKTYRKKLGFRTHLNIGEGDYVTLNGYGKLYAEDKAPEPVKNEDGSYPTGQYKAGLDIPVGKYELNYGNAGSVAYIVISVGGVTAFFDDGDEIKPSEMTEHVVDLKYGDYIYLYMCSLVPEGALQ